MHNSFAQLAVCRHEFVSLFIFSFVAITFNRYFGFGFSVPRYYGTALSEPYDGPSVKTAIPGPKSKALLNKLNALQASYFELVLFFLVIFPSAIVRLVH